MSRTIYLNRDWVYRRHLTQWDHTTGTYVNAVGLEPQCYLSLTKNPATPLASTTLTLTASGSGNYDATLDAAVIATALAARVGLFVYEICEITGDYQDAIALRVSAIEVLA